jgi:MFS transporter, DHA2 family, methylenomycin A resistance protein
MTVRTPAPAPPGVRGAQGGRVPFSPALVAALLGFFIVTFDAVVLNVALPTIQRDLGSSIAGVAFFALASLGCGLAPGLPVLVIARFVQGTAGPGRGPASSRGS